MLRVTHGEGYCVEGGRTSRRVSAPGRRGGGWGSRRARVRFFAGKWKIHRRARGGCFGGPPRPGRGASVRAYLGAARASGARAPGRTIWPVPAGDAARRASSVSRSRAVSGGSRGRGKEDVARGVLTVGRGVGGTRTTGEGVDGSGLAGANEGPATKGGARGGSAMRSARRPRVSTARRGSGRDVRALEAHPMPTSPRASPAPRGASRRAFSSSPRAPPRASA